MIGKQLDRYLIKALIGRGGMAAVYLAEDTNLGREVALKVLDQQTLVQSETIDRFRREARTVASLRHPNIVQIYDFGEHEGTLYMVQELLVGPSLEMRLLDLHQRQQRMPLAEIATLIEQIATALDAAHAAGVIHRDVKPGNVLWNSVGQAVLTDFGIARASQDQQNLTQVGLVIGTPTYLSPEQAQSQPPSPASDIYALGILLYELLSGRPPFGGDTPLGVAMQHIQAPPPPLPAEVSPPIAAVVQQALAKNPADRFVSAGAFAAAFKSALYHPPTTPSAVHNEPTQRWQPAPSAPPGPSTPPPPQPDPSGAQVTQTPPTPLAPPPSSHPPVTGPTTFFPQTQPKPEVPATAGRTPNPSRAPLLAFVAFGLVLLVGLGSFLFGRGEESEQMAAIVPIAPTSVEEPTPVAVEAAPPVDEVAPEEPPVEAGDEPEPPPPANSPSNRYLGEMYELLVNADEDQIRRQDRDDFLRRIDDIQQHLDDRNQDRFEREAERFKERIERAEDRDQISEQLAERLLDLLDDAEDEFDD